MSIFFRPTLPATTAICLLAFAGCSKQSDAIKIGEFASLTGKEAAFGQSSHKGTLLAIEEANAAGGVLGLKIELVSEDNQSKAGESATIAKKLISRDKVVAILGEVASSRSLEAAPICQAAKIPQISPSSTNPAVTETGNYIFRVCFIDPFQGQVMAKYAYETLKLRRVAVLQDLKSDYSVGLAEYFTKAFEAQGGKVVAVQTYAKDDQDFRAQLTSIKTSKPEGVFLPGYYTEVGLIVRQARDLGLGIPFFGGDGWEAEQLTQIGGKALDSCYFSTHYSVENPDPTVQNFVKNYKDRWKHAPDALAALGYDSAKLLLSAITELSKSDPAGFQSLQGSPTAGNREARKAAQAKLRDILAATRDFPGVTGKISINAQRNAEKAAVILRIQGGQFKYAGTVAP
jgi:branched-chain amino acid transport system substrate-binding protein